MRQPPPSPSAGRLPAGLRALAHPGFRRYCWGQGLSALGTAIEQAALAWLVYRLTGSTSLLGLTAFAAAAPQLVVGPLAGAWIDRHDLRRLLLVVQALFVLQATALAWLTWSGGITPAQIVGIALLLGTLAAFDIPLRQALIGRLLADSTDLPSALALNGMLLNAGRLLGPPLAGAMIGLGSEALCFAANALSYVVLLAVVLSVRLAPSPPARGTLAHLLREGLRHAFADPALRRLFVAMAVLNFTATASLALLPAFAADRLGGDAQVLGLLMGATGAGAFAAMLDLSRRRGLPSLTTAVRTGLATSVAALLLLAVADRLAAAVAAAALLGFALSLANVGIGTLAQLITPAELRGRIVSLLVAFRFGFEALGALLAGLVAGGWGLGATLAAAAMILLLPAARRR
jgi:MFS family permease